MQSIGTALQAIAQRLLSKQLSESKPVRYFEPACEACSDTGWTITANGARPCGCAQAKRVAQKLAAINRRYGKFAEFDLMGLRPRPDIHPAQAGLVPAVQADPEMSLLMFGDTGTGKTLIGYALAKYAIERGRPVVAVTLAELLDQYRTQARDTEKLPVIDAETLRTAPDKYLIFIDEIDKTRPTEFAGEKFFQLANAIYETGQQVIIASNLPKSHLMAHWERAGQGDFNGEFSQYGAPILRRFSEVENSAEVDFFSTRV